MATENLISDGNTKVFLNEWNDNAITILADGTFGGGTLEAQISANNSDYVGLGTDAQLSSDGAYNITLAKNTYFRVNLSSSTSPDININILGEGFTTI